MSIALLNNHFKLLGCPMARSVRSSCSPSPDNVLMTKMVIVVTIVCERCSWLPFCVKNSNPNRSISNLILKCTLTSLLSRDRRSFFQLLLLLPCLLPLFIPCCYIPSTSFIHPHVGSYDRTSIHIFFQQIFLSFVIFVIPDILSWPSTCNTIYHSKVSLKTTLSATTGRRLNQDVLMHENHLKIYLTVIHCRISE